jgi:hypothetical protein
MSTKSTIWLGEDAGKTVHIYWELAERIPRKAAPVFISVHAGDCNDQVAIRLPKDLAEILLSKLDPEWRTGAWEII